MRPTVLALICLAAASRPAAAQETSSQGAFFSWGTINIALAPDTASGLRLLSATTPQAGRGIAQRGLETNFMPDSALAWAAQADSFLAHPPDTGWSLSHSVVDRWGAGMTLAQHREKAGGHVDQYLVLFYAGGRNPLRIKLTPNAAEEFLRGVREQAARAGWSPPGIVSTAQVTVSDTVLVQQPPALLHGPMLQYPELLQQEGIVGAVWARIIVDTTGHPEPATLDILFSNHIAFTEEVRRWAKYAVFRPATLNGHPIKAVVLIPFTFTLR